MPDAYDAILDGRQTVFDTLNELTRDVDTVSLLKQSATSDAFETVMDVSDHWFFKPATTKQNALLEIAKDDQDLTDAMATATHIQIGDDIFTIVQTDVIPPSGFAVTWKIFVEMFQSRSQIKPVY